MIKGIVQQGELSLNYTASTGTKEKGFHACIGAAVRALEPELFLKILPLNLDVENISETSTTEISEARERRMRR